jgi:hypothetical protein
VRPEEDYRRDAEAQRVREEEEETKAGGGLHGLEDYMDNSTYEFLNLCNLLIHVIPIESFFCFFFFSPRPPRPLREILLCFAAIE